MNNTFLVAPDPLASLIQDYCLRFKLRNVYNPFLEKLLKGTYWNAAAQLFSSSSVLCVMHSFTVL